MRSVLHCTENSKQIFPEDKLRSLVPDFYIHVSVRDLYITTIGSPILLYCFTDRLLEYRNRSQIYECRNWERCRAVSFLGIFVFEFAGQCIYNCNGFRGNKQPTDLYTSCADHSNSNTLVTCYSAVQRKLLMIFRIKYWSDNSSDQSCLQNNHLSQMLSK